MQPIIWKRPAKPRPPPPNKGLKEHALLESRAVVMLLTAFGLEPRRRRGAIEVASMISRRKRKRTYIPASAPGLRVRNEIRPSKAVLEDRARRRELEAECLDPNVLLLGDPPPARSVLAQKASR